MRTHADVIVNNNGENEGRAIGDVVTFLSNITA
jgi:hypothetical protein